MLGPGATHVKDADAELLRDLCRVGKDAAVGREQVRRRARVDPNHDVDAGVAWDRLQLGAAELTNRLEPLEARGAEPRLHEALLRGRHGRHANAPVEHWISW